MQRILIIDDDEQVRAYVRRILAKSDYEVVEASNGADAKKVFATQSLSLVITDMLMPKKDGIETIISLFDHVPAIPIIAISGGGVLGSDYYLESARHFGADVTLQKPFSPDQLTQAIQLAYDKNRSTNSACEHQTRN